ncbi:AAA family ATPase [Nesterenkonia alkaliphila]|uniref:AAA family ATPase n=1 Tax=Nesterenkonia alkaliphila TaxID=1463631 RepID=A0A7K1UMR5_9MICC|nr:AAA family ATPase [Nesterenkonia alkaliphila]MVT27734.1 AAA family ATPase [Nesterenkonia alkaliphila]
MAQRSWLEDERPVRGVRVYDDAQIDDAAWPATVPAVASFLEQARKRPDGFEFQEGVTFLVGENGSGKSTLVEGIAEAFGLPSEGGTTNGGARTRRTDSPLGEWLRVIRGPGAPKFGFFLRAETMHGYYTWREQIGGPSADLHRMSHGESFNSLLESHLDHGQFVQGLVCLDEPEAALSFNSLLGWVAALDRMASRGTQVICATHSPVLASLPGATILELGEWGIRETSWEDLELVQSHRRYLEAPERYLRHLLA